MQVRSMYEPYLSSALNFLDNLIPLVTELQFTVGGPIIAIQVTHLSLTKKMNFFYPSILRSRMNSELLDTVTILMTHSISKLFCNA